MLCVKNISTHDSINKGYSLSHKKEDIVTYTRDINDKIMSKMFLQKIRQHKKRVPQK